MNVQLRSNGISYDVYKHVGTTVLTHRIDINFKNCSENLEIIPEKKVDFHTNIILAGRGTFSKISHYERITYKNVYDKIDFIFKIDPITQSYKYDVVLHPGAKINDIAMIYKGFTEISLVDGEIIIDNSIRKVKEQIPLSFNARTNKPVQVEFKLVKNGS